MMLDKTKNLSQLENKSWQGKIPTEDDSHVLLKAYELLYKKLEDFSIEDLRFYIGQNEGLEYLIPLALEELNCDILAEGDFYEGDLLYTVLKIDSAFWNNQLALKDNLSQILIREKQTLVNELDPSIKVDNELLQSAFSFIEE